LVCLPSGWSQDPSPDWLDSGEWTSLGSLTTAEVVLKFVKPLTAKHKCCLADAFHLTRFGKQCLEAFGRATGGYTCGIEYRFSKAKYFVSHAWGGSFGGLVHDLVAEAKYMDDSNSSFWVDIFAVSCSQPFLTLVY
jgi:hypothetical protein